MSDRLMGALLSASNFRGGAAWTFVWQSTLWLAIGLIAARIWRRRAGRAHLLLILATSAALISPLLTVTVHWMQWGVLPSPPETVSAAPETATAPLEVPQETPQSVAIAPIELPIHPPSNAAPAPEPNVRQPIAAAEERPAAPAEPQSASQPEAVSPAWTARVAGLVPLVIAGVWVTASLVLTMRLVLSLFAGRRIARRAREEPNPRLREALREAADALSLSSPPHLRVSDLLRCPMIWCWGTRAVVLLPESVSEQAPIFWRSVFCHELAHLIRRDHWSALWAEFMVIILPWQPLGWRCRRRLAYLREQACDDWVLAAGGTATEYAESLLQFVPQGSPVHALAAVSSRESLKRRLEHVLAGVRIAPKAGRGWIAAASLFALTGIAGVSLAQQGRRAPAPAVVAEVKPAAKPTGQESPPPALSPGVVTVRGRVLLPNGRPAVGATVRAVKWAYHQFGARPEEQTVLATLVVDSQGGFQGNVDVGPLGEPGLEINLWATLSGYGLALHPLVPAEKSGLIEMKLVEDELIRGRVVDLEGQPVRDARIEVFRYYDTTTQWVDQFLASAAAVQGAPDTVLFNVMRDEAKPGRDQVVLRIKAMESVSDVLIPAVKTNADGRFEIKGCGRDRLIDAAISGPRIATVDTPILTRPIKSLQFSHREVFGSQCECVAPPSVPVEGAVADEETGQPIPGARIIHTAVRRGSGILGSDPRLALRLSRTTDAQGHYRLEGLETGSANSFQITVPDLPYPPVENLSLPASTSLKPIQHDIKLRRGVWAVGRAYDRKDGKPVAGMVYYTPFRSNKFARNYERYRKQPTDFLANYPFGSVDGDGRFKIPVIPGRGVVCLKCTEGNYRPNLGRGEIKELAGSDRMTSALSGPTYERLLSEPFHAVREINVPIDARETHVDLPVDPGQNVVLTLTDASGNPLAGLDTYGLRLDWRNRMDRNRSYVEGSSTLLPGSSPDETRTIWIRHRATGLFKLLRFTPKPGETARTIVLEPPAVVTGRLVTPEGAPISGSEIEVVFDPNSADRLPIMTTDADGRFREELPAGGPFGLYAHPFPYAFFVNKLSVDAGERVDLGVITIDRDQKSRPFQPKVHRGPEKRTKPLAAAQASTVPAPASTARPMLKGDVAKGGPATIIHGTVLRPDGQPAGEATVSQYQFSWSSGDRIEWKLLGSTQTNRRGDFELPSQPGDEREDASHFLFATANGLGCAFSRGYREPPKSQVMGLVPDQAIRGRVLDLEGKPVAGARVRVVTITDSLNRSLGPWLDAMKSGVPRYTLGAHALLGDHIKTIPGDGGSTTTDHDGRFTLPGLGAERVVDVSIESDATAYTQVTVATRRMEPIIHPALPKGYGGLEIFGADFMKAVQPTRPAAGTVRDATTGKPLPGVAIESWQLAGGSLAGQRALRTTSDAQGRYRLVGLPKGNGNALFIVPNDDQPYFMREIVVPDGSGIEPVTVDIELHRGLWITGRVTDKDTGKPLFSRVNYWPFLTNTHTGGLPEFGPGHNMQGDYARYRTRPDGTFRIPGLPGRGLVGAEAMVSTYRQGAGASDIGDVDREGRLRTYRNQGWPSLKYPTTMKAINPAEGTENVVCDLVCDHGETVRITVLDPLGRPVHNCSTSAVTKNGRTQGIDSPFDLSNLPLNVEQPLLIQQKERKLAKLIKFTLKEQSPRSLTVQLDPCATVVGRLVDDDGTALEGITLQPRFRRSGDYWPSLPTVVCNRDGRFEYPSLPSGAEVDFFAEGTGIEFLQRFGRLSAQAGKTIDLGDIKVKRRQ